MHPEVSQLFPAFTTKFEGRVLHFYLDVKGLVTIGVGCLVDPVETAIRLPMFHGDGTQASSSAIEAEWRIIKAHQELSKLHYRFATQYARLRMTEDGVDDLLRQRLGNNDRILAAAFAPGQYDAFPADVQMALHSMSWALGAGFFKKWPNFHAACKAEDWVAAANNCRIREEGNPGVVPRNQANRRLFQAAAEAKANPPPPEPAGITEDDRARLLMQRQAFLDEITDFKPADLRDHEAEKEA